MSKAKTIHFFATKRDIESLLSEVEAQRRIKYTQAGMFDDSTVPTFESGLQIPNLGFSRTGDSNADAFWLITDAEVTVAIDTVPQRRGGVRYSVDPESNPESVVLWPGGVFGNSCVIAGQVYTAATNHASIELVTLFAHAIRRNFRRIKSFYVGAEAEQLLDSGYRLTHSVKTARTSDLSKS